MSYRYMRMMIMFDLPTFSLQDLREYRKFRKFLIENGFIMMQESIYTKLLLNAASANLMSKQVKKVVPKDGLVQMLIVTEKQFAGMELLSGELNSTYINSDKRYLEL